MAFEHTAEIIAERAALKAQLIAEVTAKLPEHRDFIIELGRVSFDKLVDMGKLRGAEYPEDTAKRISLGLQAANALFSGKHRNAKVDAAVSTVRDACMLGMLPVLTA